MKKVLLFAILLGTLSTAIAQTHLYEHPKFDNITQNHKTIAIIPFKTQVKLRPKQMKDVTAEALADIEKNEAIGLQAGMHSWFLKRKKRGKFELDVQEPSRTNAILKKANITYNNLEDQLPEDLAELLGVDAVITGTFETNKPMSEGASIALGVLIGFWGNTNNAIVNMNINNATDGVLLWNYNKKVRGSIGSSPEDLVNILMRKASRRLSYTK